MRNLILFFSAIAFFASCKDKVKLNLEAEVIAIHDEVMPKMGELHAAKMSLKKLLASTNDETSKGQILTLINELEKADEGMMAWMHDWKVPEQDPEKSKYLKMEKEKITKVKVDMLSSLKKANEFIDKNSPQ